MVEDKLKLSSSELEQLQQAIRVLENKNNNNSLKNLSNQDLSINNKTDYEQKNFNGEKVEDFRKQGEYGPKKFIKP
jgi:hypothetical protein